MGVLYATCIVLVQPLEIVQGLASPFAGQRVGSDERSIRFAHTFQQRVLLRRTFRTTA